MAASTERGAIVLTAAVTPDKRYGVSLADPVIRLRQYESAINHWWTIAQNRHLALCVVETTGFDLASGADVPQGVRLIEHRPSSSASDNGKGAVEAEALDRAVDALILSNPQLTGIYKVTGRLRLANPQDVFGSEYMASLRVRRTLDRAFCDTRFIQVPVTIWREFLTQMGDEVRDEQGRFLEHVLARRLVDAEYAGFSVDRFARRPVLIGQSGTSAKMYGKTSLNSTQMMATLERNMRRIAHHKQV